MVEHLTTQLWWASTQLLVVVFSPNIQSSYYGNSEFGNTLRWKHWYWLVMIPVCCLRRSSGPNAETWNWSFIILAQVSLYVTDLMRQNFKGWGQKLMGFISENIIFFLILVLESSISWNIRNFSGGKFFLFFSGLGLKVS